MILQCQSDAGDVGRLNDEANFRLGAVITSCSIFTNSRWRDSQKGQYIYTQPLYITGSCPVSQPIEDY